MCVGKTLNMDSGSKFWGNLEGIWGNPGKMRRINIGWKIPGVYRVKSYLFKPFPTVLIPSLARDHRLFTFQRGHSLRRV